MAGGPGPWDSRSGCPISRVFCEKWAFNTAATNNRLSGFGYDAAGNMTSNGSASYVHDAENRLIATAGYSYLYDGDGQRVEKCTERHDAGHMCERCHGNPLLERQFRKRCPDGD